MSRLFGRTYRLTVGDRQWTELDIEFDIDRSSGRPGRATVVLWNLSRPSRDALAQSHDARVELLAGYDVEQHLIFAGLVRGATSTRDGAEWRTELRCLDGAGALTRRVSFAARSDRSIGEVLEACAVALGVGIGNAREAFAAAGLLAGGRAVRSAVLAGSAAAELEGLCVSAGLEWSIQDGVLQVSLEGDSSERSALLLSASSGLVGSPQVSRHGVEFDALMVPGLRPGALVQLEAANGSGTYRCRGVRYVGSTSGDSWGCHVQARGGSRAQA
jgi:hypothetical protein